MVIADAVDLGIRLLLLLHRTVAMWEAISFPACDVQTLKAITEKVVHGSDKVSPAVLGFLAKKAATAGGDARFESEVVRQAVRH